MKRNLSILLFTMSLMTVLSGCEEKELLKHHSVYGEATINDKVLLQYTTIGEGVSNKYWFLPLGNDNRFIVKDDVCYLQMFLRDGEEKATEDFWLVLVGCHADADFPVIGKEYPIVVQPQVDLGNVYNSFYGSGELRDFYAGHSESASYGIAGLSVPPSHEELIPLDGSLRFLKGDSKSGEYSISYNLLSEENVAGTSYRVKGEMNGKLKMVD